MQTLGDGLATVAQPWWFSHSANVGFEDPARPLSGWLIARSGHI